MEYRPGPTAPWTDVKTGRGGADVFVISFRGAGDYALVHLRGAQVSGGTSAEALLLVLLGGFVVLVLAAAVLARRPWQRAARDGTGGT